MHSLLQGIKAIVKGRTHWNPLQLPLYIPHAWENWKNKSYQQKADESQQITMHYYKLNQVIILSTAVILETVLLLELIIKAYGTWYAAGVVQFLCFLLSESGSEGCMQPFSMVAQVIRGSSSKCVRVSWCPRNIYQLLSGAWLLMARLEFRGPGLPRKRKTPWRPHLHHNPVL